MVRSCRALIAVIGLLLAAPATAATEISVAPDRTDIAVDESFQLRFKATGEPDDGPDFAPLENDFEILTQSESQSVKILGGRSNREQEWNLSLMPRRAGTLRIPSIAFGSDRSPALELQVRPSRQGSASGNAEVFLEVGLDRELTWVGAQSVLTVRIFHAPELRGGRLQAPRLDDADAVVEVLGEDRSYHTQRSGRRYFVIERRFLIFPQRAGRHRIEPLSFQGQILMPTTRIDPFRQRTRTIRLQSDALSLEVLPIPLEFNGRPWLPARSLQLAEHWTDDPPQLRQGEPVTRTIAVIADGLLATQLPELDAAVPDSLKIYPDQPRLESRKKDTGVIGLREEKHAIIASQTGPVELPGMQLMWFNTRTGETEIARLPARTLQVAAAATDVLAAILPPADVAAAAAAARPTANPVWAWLSLLLALGWGATLLAWWRSASGRRAALREPGPALPARSVQTAVRQLQQACARADPGAAERALLDWAAAIWPQHAPTSLGAVARRLDPGTGAVVRRLEALRYANATPDQDCLQDLLAAIRAWRPAEPAANHARLALPPLHPNL